MRPRRRGFPDLDESKIERSRPVGGGSELRGSDKSDLERALAFAIRAAGLPAPETQYSYVPGRKFAADFAWPEARLLVEVQGGVYTRGAHGSVGGVLRDIERLNLATLAGWRMLRFAGQHIERGEAIEVIEEALTAPGWGS